MKSHTSFLAGAGLLFLLAFSVFGQGQNPGRRVSDAPEPVASDNRYLIQFRTWGPQQARAAVARAGGQVVHEFPELRAVAARLTSQAASALQNNPSIEFVEADPRRYMMSNRRSSSQVVPYGISMVQADQITGANPSNRKVCIIDSGYYLGHEDLQQAYVTGAADGGAGVWRQDGFGHGTHVAGTIAALNNNLGVIGVNSGGVLYMHIVRVFGDDGNWAYASTLVAALNECQAAKANVVSMSLGGDHSSRVEHVAFSNAYAAGVLSVAAAGNGGNRRTSYPAGYDSVISVAAIDSNYKLASFSQLNNDIELSAPGVGVLSTLPYVETSTVSSNGTTYAGTWIEFSARSTGVTSVLADGGLCSSTNSAWKGQVVLCQRGSISFYDKVHNVQLSGGVAAIIYNNVDGGFNGTLGDGNSSTIPAIGISLADGSALKASGIGQNATVVSTRQQPASGYEAWDGTSMATPHVSGVAALIWSFNPAWTNVQIRKALQATALDLGAKGRDSSYGFGLVQARAALTYLQAY